MSSGDAPLTPSKYSSFESRRGSGNTPIDYDRLGNAPRQNSPTPSPSRRVYDSYVPYRTENRNGYRSDSYRPDHSYNRSPTPDDSRSSGLLSHRGSSWRPLSKVYDPPERHSLPVSSTSRRFEPSDSWKQAHTGRSVRENFPPSERHLERRRRDSLESSERSPRLDRPYITVPERHASLPFRRETWPELRRSDTYRPQYDTDRSRGHYLQSPTNGHTRRESESSGYSRSSEYGRPTPRKPSVSGQVLESPPPVIRSPKLTHSVPSLAPLSLLDVAKRNPPSRQSSRSSIASSHVSDRSSPGIASIPQPFGCSPASLPARPQATIGALTNEMRRDNGEVGTKTVHSGVVSQHPMNAVDTETPTKDSVREPTNDQSQNSDVVSQTLRGAPTTQDMSPTSKSGDKSSANDKAPAMTEQQSALDGPSMPRKASPPTIIESAPTTSQGSTLTPNGCIVDTEQPEPVPLLERALGAKNCDVMDVDIPPTTHSPSPLEDPANATITERSNPPRLENIPPLSSAKTREEALRITVMTRMNRDHQSREARINPVLMSNLAIAPPSEVHPASTPSMLMDKMFDGLTNDSRRESAQKTRPFLVKHFSQRQVMIDEKVGNLRKEYAALHERWLAHCNALNEQHRTLASEQENQPQTRTTRRSMAFTDTVRSDFEMEQVIASLGNDEATDPNHLSMRNLAKVPDMISAVNGRVDVVFDDTNHLVENPADYYAPHTGMHDWTEAERKIFMEKFGAYPKQFGVIADFLPNKTASQCVAYYYLQKKMFIDFRKVVFQYAPNKRKRRGMGRKKGNGLLADIAMHDMEVHRVSGSASPLTSNITSRTSRRRTLNATVPAKQPSSRRNAVQFEDTPTSTPTPEPESKSRKRKVASGTNTPIASNTAPIFLNSSLSLLSATPSLPPQTHTFIAQPLIHYTLNTPVSLEEERSEVGARPSKRAKGSRRIKSSVMVIENSVSLPLQTGANDDIGGKKESAAPPNLQWTNEDKNLFLDLLAQYGTNFKQIASSMPSKSTTSVTNYYKANLTALNLAEIAAKGLRCSPSLDLRDPHWKEMTFPVSEPILSSSSQPSSSASLMQPQPISVAGYDLAKDAYLASSALPYRNQSSEDTRSSSSWSGPTLPTRMPQRQTHIVSPTLPSVSGLEGTRPPSQSPHQAGYSPLISRNTSLSYRYIPHPGIPAEQHVYNPPPSGRYHDGPHPPTLPTRQAHSPSPTWSLEEQRENSRPRISVPTSGATAHTHSPPPHSSIVSGPSVSGYVPGLPSAATSIIHSPTIPSPKLPLHRETTFYEPHPLPPPSQGSGPSPRGDTRDPTSRYPPAAPRSPVNSFSPGHSRQRSGSSATGWGHPMSGFPLQRNRYYDTSDSPLPHDLFSVQTRGAPVSGTKGVGNSDVNNEMKRETPYNATTADRSNSNVHTNHSRGRSDHKPSAVWTWAPRDDWIG